MHKELIAVNSNLRIQKFQCFCFGLGGCLLMGRGQNPERMHNNNRPRAGTKVQGQRVEWMKQRHTHRNCPHFSLPCLLVGHRSTMYQIYGGDDCPLYSKARPGQLSKLVNLVLPWTCQALNPPFKGGDLHVATKKRGNAKPGFKFEVGGCVVHVNRMQIGYLCYCNTTF